MCRTNWSKLYSTAAFAIFLMMFAGGNPALAQAPTATLVGQVVDVSRAAIAGATIKVRNTATNEVRTAKTGSRGEYSVTTLTPGVYNVTISMEGFQELRETRLELSVAQTARLDATLKIGSTTESVSVTADVGLLNTETSSKGGVITPVEIAEIPLNGRDFNDLAFTVAGVQPAEQGGKGSPYVTNGSRADSTSFFIDGINDENARDAGAQIQPPLDSLQEFKMETSNYGAQYGMGSGGVINLQLKSGGNQIHGSIFEFIRNDAFDARNYFDAPGTKSELRRNQFGASIGGPIFIPHLYNGHDRTFFFVSWESLRQVNGSNSIGTVPTPLERMGDFSNSFDSSKGTALATLVTPFTTGPCAADSVTKKGKKYFPDNKIDLNACLNPVGAKLLAYYPLPNRIVSQNIVSLPAQPSKITEAIVTSICTSISAHKQKRFDGIGISFPDRADFRRDKLLFAPETRRSLLALKAAIESATGLSVAMDNAANACALSEVWFKDSGQDLAVVSVAEGIQVGIFANGRLLRGENGMAGRFGHIQIEPEGLICGCGGRGCWETVASNSAGLHYYRSIGGTARPRNFAELIRLAQAGDGIAIEAIQRMSIMLGRGLRMIVSVLAPSEIIVVGDITSGWNLFGPTIEKELRRNSLSKDPCLRPSTEAGMARLRSAIALVMNEVIV